MDDRELLVAHLVLRMGRHLAGAFADDPDELGVRAAGSCQRRRFRALCRRPVTRRTPGPAELLFARVLLPGCVAAARRNENGAHENNAARNALGVIQQMHLVSDQSCAECYHDERARPGLAGSLAPGGVPVTSEGRCAVRDGRIAPRRGRPPRRQPARDTAARRLCARRAARRRSRDPRAFDPGTCRRPERNDGSRRPG
jgi:hypothetical protein